MGTLQLKKLAAALEAEATIHIFAVGTQDLLADLVDLNGDPLPNPFTVAEAGGVEHWGCVVLDDQQRYDAWWAEAGGYIALAEGGTLLMTVTQAQAEDTADAVIYMWSPQRVWQAVIKWASSTASVFSGRLKGVSEEIVTVALADGQDLTVDFNTNGLVLVIDETVSTFTLTKGAWPDTTLASMLIYIKEIGVGGSAPAIIWAAGWGFHALHTPAVADGRTADTGYSQLELYRIVGVQFCKVVEEA